MRNLSKTVTTVDEAGGATGTIDKLCKCQATGAVATTKVFHFLC